MKCEICKSNDLSMAYFGKIRDGAVGNLTGIKYEIWQCNKCKTLWHDTFEEEDDYYQSTQYRTSIDGSADIERYYQIYDKLVINRLEWTGTEIFRNKVVADIGCGGGSLLDYISVVAEKTIGVEPSKIQRKEIEKKGHIAREYIENAVADYKGQVDIITCFDVIEHVKSPHDFTKGMFELANKGAKVICGTPTDYPLLRNLLEKKFEEFVFDIQHPWIFTEDALKILFENAGFTNIRIERKQQYGLGNFISWLLDGVPKGDVKLDFITGMLDKVFREEIVKTTGGDYLVLFAEKH